MDDDVKLICPSKESTINNQLEDRKLESRFECPICLSWLQDPLLTSCGHKFCSQCIHKWLKRDGACCPIDNIPLKPENDLFRDLHTSREISQQRVNCPYELLGCTVQLSPIDMQSHISQCTHKKNVISDEEIQSNDNLNRVDDVDTTDNQSINKLVPSEVEKSKFSPESKKIDIFSKNCENDQESTDWQKFLKNLFERIVTLEQLNRELSITIQNQQTTITNLQNRIQLAEERVDSKACNGIYIWRFNFFNERLREMQSDPMKMFYSSSFYTNTNGYKICLRVNISSKNRDFLSVVMHIMRSENDDGLNWPFNGMISFNLIHPSDSTKSISEKTLSRPNLEAFKKPTEDLNKRSFGYTEFVAIHELQNFVQDNSLIFRVEVIPIKSCQ